MIGREGVLLGQRDRHDELRALISERHGLARELGTGFGLGTIPGHAASGEERFLVSLDPDNGLVHYEVQAISRPAVWLAKLGRPAMRWLQGRFRAESCETMQGLARGG